jgi:hypothetical protein
LSKELKSIVESKVKELAEITGTNVFLESAGGWVCIKIMPSFTICRAHGYYDLNRYLNENWQYVINNLIQFKETNKECFISKANTRINFGCFGGS